ncbi:MAG: cytochrome C oxidase subunit IV family protein [Elusimicrobia bacterium]|nr:cytochrome C oxidase subunit IV family protein [Elusimicrobiota bacterium]
MTTERIPSEPDAGAGQQPAGAAETEYSDRLRDAKSQHGPSYWTIFGWLVFFTVLEVSAVYLGLPKAPLAIFLVSTAIAKAMLVALYFMHIRFEGRWVYWVTLLPLVVGAIFILALFPDIAFFSHR